MQIVPRTEDVSYTMKLSCTKNCKLDKRKVNIFLRNYEKIYPLTKKEKSFLIPLMIRSNVLVFWWMSEEMKKGQEDKFYMLEWCVKLTRNLVKEWR